VGLELARLRGRRNGPPLSEAVVPSQVQSLRIVELRAYTRAVRFRLPFRFGSATVSEAPQAFVRAWIELGDGTLGEGWAAELMVPKWFDKDPRRSSEDDLAELRRSVLRALAFHRDAARVTTAFAHAEAWREASAAGEVAGDTNRLAGGFGAALVDRAVIDALCGALGLPFPAAVRRNLLGIALAEPEGCGPDFDGDRFLATLQPAAHIAARHTIGLADALTRQERPAPGRLDDGLPESLEEPVDAYGHRFFKLKLGADVPGALERMRRVAQVLEPLPDYHVTLDGNEQFRAVSEVSSLLEELERDAGLARFRRALLYLEQPLHRDVALEVDVSPLARHLPLVVDESDDSDDAFLRARACGYTGISSKTCKGVYRAIRNRARCQAWNQGGNGPFFVTAEDLTCQAGLSLQQDLLLAGLLGCRHGERNGHHYVHGMVGASPAEQESFAVAHPALYDRGPRGVHLRIREGRIALETLACPGFASGATPDEATLVPMEP